MAREYRILINGEWVEATSREKFEVINPANGQVVGVVPKCNSKDVDKAVDAAHRAAPAWAAKTMAERSKVLLKISQLIMMHQEELANRRRWSRVLLSERQ